jgi:hypothetical protein
MMRSATIHPSSAAAALRVGPIAPLALALALALATVWGCAAAGVDKAPARPEVSESIVDPPRRPGKPLVFIAMPGSTPFRATRKGLIDELAASFDVSTLVIDARTSGDAFQAALERAAPACVVLMNNSTVRLYRDYQRRRPGARFPPAVVMMASYLEDMRGELRNATGISYEVPGVTAFVGLRALIKAPVSRVGVIHLRSSQEFVARQRALAAKEHFDLVSIEVSAQPTLKEIQNALRAFRTVYRIDALWVLNDNRLLKDGRFLVEVWQPQLDALAVPVIVGAAPLVNQQSSFGTFAVLPEHPDLGVQGANLILDLADAGWNADAHPIELPVSTINVLDVAQAREKFGLRDGAVDRVDRRVE